MVGRAALIKLHRGRIDPIGGRADQLEALVTVGAVDGLYLAVDADQDFRHSTCSPLRRQAAAAVEALPDAFLAISRSS